MNAIQVFVRMNELGYDFELVGDSFRPRKARQTENPKPGEIESLLASLKENKSALMTMLAEHKILNSALEIYRATDDPKPYAEAAIKFGMQFYDSEGTDIGEFGWRKWAGMPGADW